ncbi:DNA polymerase III subunits gamma/tau [Candidatus Magnetoovum chiemensis]|nr:DNA polymerase III subunits gamma/tau [Candidatus Magnetoovum chiemensis]
MIGQNTIVKILQNSISENRLAHAYVFSGPRGVGKTTTARILAKALNCGSGVTPSPCGTCSQCAAIRDGYFLDVIEIDGASNNSVEDIRELREKVKYTPSGSRYKVYIIDEAHMLSKSAFNALLKTLEEPPSHIIFIMATTEPAKILPTVLSRCQHLPFRRVSSDRIAQHIKEIAEKEGFKITDQACKIIAQTADGSIRDSLTLLEQLSSFTSDITEENVNALFGLSDKHIIYDMAKAVLKGKKLDVFALIDNIYESGSDLNFFLIGLINLFRQTLVLTSGAVNKEISKEEQEIIDISNEDMLILILNELLKAEELMKNASSTRIALEMALLKIASLNAVKPINAILKQINDMLNKPSDIKNGIISYNNTDRLENNKIGEDDIKNTPAQELRHPAQKNNQEALIDVEPEPYCTLPSLDDKDGFKPLWEKLIKKTYDVKFPLGAKLSQASFELHDDTVNIILQGGDTVHADSIESQKTLLNQLLKEITGKYYAIKITKLKNASAKDTSSSEVNYRQKALSDPIVKDALNLFNGTIADVKPIKKTN